jgi:hypothetical protein
MGIQTLQTLSDYMQARCLTTKWDNPRDVQAWLLEHSERDPETGCLLAHGFGWGTSAFRGTYQKGPGRAFSHVAAYLAHHAFRDTGLDVAHLCGVHACVEVTHLSQMTRSQNMIMDNVRKNPDRLTCRGCGDLRVTTKAGKLESCREFQRRAQRAWQDRQRAKD